MADNVAAALRVAARMVDRSPTEAQKEAGNYRKGHVRLHGLDIAIENPKGGERSGIDKGGKRWTCVMPAHYGYVKRTEGKDGDAVDVYIGPEPDSNKVFVVDQVDAGTGRFDEHKCCLGYTSKEQALADYEKAFSDGKAKDRIGSVTAMSVEDFKGWLKDGDTTKPMSRKAYASGGSVVASALRIARKRADGGAVSDLYGETYKPDLGSDSEGDITTADMLARMKARDAGFPGALRDVARAIPHVEADDTSTASGIISRLGRTATEIPRSSLNTVANWLGRTPEIGPDTIAPLGLAPMGSLVGHSASLAKPSVADSARARYLEWKHPDDFPAISGGEGQFNSAKYLGEADRMARESPHSIRDARLATDYPRETIPSPANDGSHIDIAYLKELAAQKARNEFRLLSDQSKASVPGTVVNSVDAAGQRAEGAATPRRDTAAAAALPERAFGKKPIKAASEDIYEVLESQFPHGRVVGNQMMPIDRLKGGVSADPAETKRVADLVAAMSGPEGYRRRLIVDSEGNVIEGQHRLEALRQLGEKNVPVHVIEDMTLGLDMDKLNAAVAALGLPKQQARQLLQNSLESAREAGSGAKALETDQFPRGWEDKYSAVLRAIDSSTRQQAKAPGAEPSIKSSGGSVGHNMHNPKIARALRTAGRYAEGGNVPLSDSGPVPGQEWPDTYDPQGGADFLGMLKDTGTGIARAIAPPIPGYNHPTLSEGAEALRAKVAGKSQGEVLREGLGEFAADAVPMVATSAFPLAGRALRAVGQGLARTPLTTGTALAGLGMTALPGEAGEKSSLQKLYEQKAILEQRRQAAELEAERERRTGKGPNYQAALGRVNQVNVEMSAVNQQITEEQKLNSPEFKLEMAQKQIDADRAQKAKDANTPIKELYPKLTAAIPYATWLASMGLGALAKGRHVSNYNKEMTDLSSRWGKALETARSGSSAAPKAVTEAEGLGRQFEAMKAAGPSSKGTILPGAALGEFGQLAPVGIDYARAQPGSDLYKKTVDTMTSPQEVAGRIVTGAMSGAIPAKIGSKLADRPKFVRGYSAETSAAREAMPRGYQPPPSNTQPQSQSSTRSTGESSTFPSRTQAEPSGSRSQTPQEPATDQVQSTSAASSSVPPMRRKDKNGRTYYHDRLTGHRTSKPDKSSNKAPADEDPPFAHGGIVRSALRIARKFGGRIGKSAGLLKSDVPGRTDHIETSVKSGSFVIPADTLSHLGQNNTMAGAKKLDEMLKTGPYGTPMGKSPSAGPKAQKALSIAKSKFASGGSVDVPILAAGGEYIISPEKVAELGGGDLDRGHAILDKFVLDVRNDHINTLQNLPEPQKD